MRLHQTSWKHTIAVSILLSNIFLLVFPSLLLAASQQYTSITPNQERQMGQPDLSVRELTTLSPLETSENVVIDVMVLYTPEAEAAASGFEGGIVGTIQQGISDANFALANSTTNVQLNAVHIARFEEISDYSGKTGDQYEADLRGNNSFSTLRSSYGADLAQLVVANIAGSVWGQFDQFSFASIVLVGRVKAPYYSMLHEFAHHIGYQAEVVDMHKFGERVIVNGQSFYTIMGKRAGGSTNFERVPQFSSKNAQLVADGAKTVSLFMNQQCQSNASLFCDIPQGHWAYDEIVDIYNRGITTGCNSAKQPWNDLPFCPNEILDRAHLAVFLVRRVHDNTPNYTPPGPYKGYFSDVPSDYAQALWIEELYELGITTGATNCSGSGTRFCPENKVRRDEMSSLLMRTERYLGNINDYESRPIFHIFDDVPTDSVHIRAIEYMWQAGFSNGCPSDDDDVILFCPSDLVDRAHAAALMARTFEYHFVRALDPLEPDDITVRASNIQLAARASNVAEATLPLAVGMIAVQDHSIVPVGDIEWVKFTVNVPSALRLTTSGEQGDTYMRLYNSQLDELEFNDDNGVNQFSRIDRECGVDELSAGIYYIRVEEFNNNDEIPSYQLSAEVTAVCTTAPFARTLYLPFNSKP